MVQVMTKNHAWLGHGVAWLGFGVAWLGYDVAWLGMAWHGWVHDPGHQKIQNLALRAKF